MRRLLSILLALLPYGYIGGLIGMLLLDLDSDTILFGFFQLFLLCSGVVIFLYGLMQRKNPNLWVKLSAVPADLLAMIFTVLKIQENIEAHNGGAMSVGLSILALIIFLIPYVICRFCTMISCAVVCARTLKESKILHILLHLIPGADLISAAMVHKRLAS